MAREARRCVSLQATQKILAKRIPAGAPSSWTIVPLFAKLFSVSQTQPTPASQQPAEAPVAQAEPISPQLKVLNWSGIFFAALQSLCSALVALSGVRLLIGVGAFTAATGALRIADRMHVSAIRIPMMLLALLGSVWNLVALWRVKSLRRRAASAWRQRPLTKQKKRSEFFQLAVAVVTLILLAAEAAAHYKAFHHF
jgi:hypothetical protein